MKKYISILSVALAASLLASCTKEANGDSTASNTNNSDITAVVPQPVMAGMSADKAVICEDGVVKFEWIKDIDAISVNSGDEGETMLYTVKSVDDTPTHCIFKVENFLLNPVADYYAVYPMTVSTSTIVPFDMAGQCQKAFDDNSHLSEYSYMTAGPVKSNRYGGLDFPFQYKVSWVVFNIISSKDFTAKEITLSSDTECFAAEGTIDLAANGQVYATSTKEVKLLLGEDGLEVKAGEEYHAVMAVMGVDAPDGIYVEVAGVDSQGAPCTLTYGNEGYDKPFVAGSYYNVNLKEVAAIGENTYGTLQAAFDVAKTAASATTINMIANCYEDVVAEMGAKNIILNLNGYVLAGSVSMTASDVVSNVFTIQTPAEKPDGKIVGDINVKNCKLSLVRNTNYVSAVEGCVTVENCADFTVQGTLVQTDSEQPAIVVKGSNSLVKVTNVAEVNAAGAAADVQAGTFKVLSNSSTSKAKVKGSITKAEGATVTVLGGIFSIAPDEEFVDPSKEIAANTDAATSEEYPYAVVKFYPVRIGDKGYDTLAEAVAAAEEGQTVQILKAGDYTVETLSTKAAVVEATVEGVVFNRTAGGWVASCNGTTVKNVTWNVGNANYQYFSNTNLENCTVNGLLCTHCTNKFKDCTFINEEGYNFWVYGNVYTEFDNCTFTCPGKNNGESGCGSALNCYNEAAQTPTPVLVVKNCTFTAKEASNKYSAIFIKPETAFDIRITNSTCNDKFFTGAISGSKLWNLSKDREGTTVSIDDVLVYPFCSKDADGNYHITNATGLLQFHDLYAAGKVAYTAKVYIDNDIDFTGKTWTACNWHADTATKGFALFDGQNHTIKNFTVSGQGMFSWWACSASIGATPYFKDIVFDGAKNVTSNLNVSLFCGQCYQDAKIENVTIKNSQFEGTYKVAPFVGTVYDEKPGSTATLTLKDCKVENTTVKGTSYDFDICGMVAFVYEGDNDKIAFEGSNVVKDVTLYIPSVYYRQCAKIYHNGETAHDEATNVTVNNVNTVIAN